MPKKIYNFFLQYVGKKNVIANKIILGSIFVRANKFTWPKFRSKFHFGQMSLWIKKILGKKKCWPTNLVWPKFSLTKKKFVHKKKFVTKICLANIFFGPNKFLWPTKFVLPMLLLGVSFTTPLSLVRARKICSEIGSHFNSR